MITKPTADRRVAAALLAALLVAGMPAGVVLAARGDRESNGGNRNEESKPRASERRGPERSGAGPGAGRERRESDEGAQKLGAPKPQAPETRSESTPSRSEATRSESAPSRSESAPAAERAPSAERKPPAASKPVRAVKQAATKVAARARHYGGKISEARHLERRAIPATLLRARIMTSTKERVMRAVPLRDLEMIHPITRESSMGKLEQRADALRGEGDQIRTTGVVDAATQDRLIPSKNPIRVIKTDTGRFGVFDGNGRVEAIMRAFPEHPDLRIEVQEFVTRGDLSNAFRRAQAGGEP